MLKAIDEFGRKRYLMNVGEDKGRIVEDLVRQRKPKTMVELGGYCGYSTILFGQAMKEEGGEHYYCLERSPKFAKNIEALVKMAGLDDVIKVVVGASNESIQSLYDSGKLTKIDMMFLDHYKPAYTTDLKLCEQLSLIHEGSVLAADNCIAPGNPPYIAYVESTPAEKRKKLRQEQKTADTENFNQRSATQYGKVEDLSLDLTGNPNIIYESKMIHSYEPTGEPVSFL